MLFHVHFGQSLFILVNGWQPLTSAGRHAATSTGLTNCPSAPSMAYGSPKESHPCSSIATTGNRQPAVRVTYRPCGRLPEPESQNTLRNGNHSVHAAVIFPAPTCRCSSLPSSVTVLSGTQMAAALHSR